MEQLERNWMKVKKLHWSLNVINLSVCSETVFSSLLYSSPVILTIAKLHKEFGAGL